jgi:hypothetical protein
MILTWKLNITGVWNFLGEISSPLHVDGYVFGTMNDEGGHPDRRDDVSDIDLTVHPHEISSSRRAGPKPLEPTHPLLRSWIIHQGRRKKR